MVVAWSRESYLGIVEITSIVFLVLLNDGGCRMSPRFHLFVSDVNQGDEEGGEFKIFLRDSRDRKILLRSSASCLK